jgi:hypothetical protein
MRSSGQWWKAGLALGVAMVAATGVALAYSYTVVFGTSGPDTINESGQNGNFHLYGFQGADELFGGNGNVTIVHGHPVIGGYDLIYGDGSCTFTPPGNDSYCAHPAPWLRQTWTDSAAGGDEIRGGMGPSWLIGGGSRNDIVGSQTYDTIVGGPRQNALIGSRLGSAVIAIYTTSSISVKVNKTLGVVGTDGLVGVGNSVDVYDPNRRTSDSVNCSGGMANQDVVFANRGDSVKHCATVYKGVAPCFPDGHTYPGGNPCAATNPPFPFPLAALAGAPFARDVRLSARGHRRRTAHHHRSGPHHLG